MSVIDNGITAKEFRLRCEDKMTLDERGAMYAGTGAKTTITTATGASKDIYITAKVAPPAGYKRIKNRLHSSIFGI